MEAACLVRRLGLPQGEEALKARLRRPGHPRLREALAAYLKRLQAPEEVFRALERLLEGGGATGREAGLIGGYVSVVDESGMTKTLSGELKRSAGTSLRKNFSRSKPAGVTTPPVS